MSGNGYKIVLIALIDLLKEQGIAGAGTVEGLNAYQALAEAKAQAEAFDVPLPEIGLEDFDLDTLLKAQTQKAA
jgi:hypothetical protein